MKCPVTESWGRRGKSSSTRILTMLINGWGKRVPSAMRDQAGQLLEGRAKQCILMSSLSMYYRIAFVGSIRE